MAKNRKGLNDSQKKMLGGFLVDVAKYITTAILIAAFFSNQGQWGPGLVIGSLAIVIALVVAGLIINRKPKNE